VGFGVTTIGYSNWFKRAGNVLSFNNCFQESGIKGFEVDFFKNAVSATSISALCSFTSDIVLPDNFFFYNSNVTNYGGCFQESARLSVGNNMFNLANLSIVTSFLQFMSKSVLSNQANGTIQDIWNYALSAISTDAFLNQTELDNYLEIPGTWGGPLISEWLFDGNADDTSTNGNDGTVNGAVLTTDRKGGVNKAYNFDGVNDYIALPTISGILDLGGDMTFSLWIYPTGATNDYFFFIDNFAPVNRLSFFIKNTNVLAFHLANTQEFSDTTTLARNVWIHVAVTMDRNGLAKFYINGSFSSSVNISSLSASPIIATGFNIGVRGDLGDHWFNGNIDEFKWYNKELSASEITTLYISQSLFAEWLFTGNANDTSGNNRHLSVDGAVLTTDRKGNPNSAYSFDGIDDGMDVNTWSIPGAYSYSVWINMPDVSSATRNTIIDFRNTTDHSVVIAQEGAGDLNVFHYDGAFKLLTINDVLVNNTWHHIVVTYNGTDTVTVYVDNVLQDTLTVSGNAGGGINGFDIGRTALGGSQFFAGVIDDIKFLSIEADAAQVSAWYNE
jgi:hypothetical protein